MKRRTRIALWLTGVLLAVGLALAGLKEWRDAHYFNGYDPALSLDVNKTAEKERDDYRRCAFTFQGVAGSSVPGLVARPIAGEGPFPCVVFLHGLGQDKKFLDRLAGPFARAGFALATFDQYTCGERVPDSGTGVRAVLALRRRAALTVIETRRIIDYLETRPDIAPDRIYLCGASFGAIAGCAATAFEPRIRAAVLTYGGGDIRALLSSQVIEDKTGRWTPLVAAVGAYLFAPADPVRYVGGISPRPLYFQNGLHDTYVPPAAAKALHRAACEPKTITWYESDHVGLEQENTETVTIDAIEWLQQIDAAGSSE